MNDLKKPKEFFLVSNQNFTAAQKAKKKEPGIGHGGTGAASPKLRVISSGTIRGCTTSKIRPNEFFGHVF